MTSQIFLGQGKISLKISPVAFALTRVGNLKEIQYSLTYVDTQKVGSNFSLFNPSLQICNPGADLYSVALFSLGSLSKEAQSDLVHIESKAEMSYFL